MGLPSQHQSPTRNPAPGVIIPRGAKFDVLKHLIIREDLLYPLVEPLGKCRQVLGGVEPGTIELLWWRIE